MFVEQSNYTKELEEDFANSTNRHRPTCVNFRSISKGLQANNVLNDSGLVLNYPHLLWHHVTHELVGGKCLY